MSCGPMWVWRVGMSIIRSSVREATSTTATRPANSQVKTAVRAVGGEVGVVDAAAVGHLEPALLLPGVPVVEDEGLARLGDRHRRAAVGQEVHVVRVDDRMRSPWAPVFGSIGVIVLPMSSVA